MYIFQSIWSTVAPDGRALFATECVLVPRHVVNSVAVSVQVTINAVVTPSVVRIAVSTSVLHYLQ